MAQYGISVPLNRLPVIAMAGNDILYGYDAAEAIDAGLGNDTVYARGGNDTVSGGAGNDGLLGEAGNDMLTSGIVHNEMWKKVA
jgi:Ca2+-binding RTX toxin-like protein